MIHQVCGALITRENGEILIAKRVENDECGGQWEFPGGKCKKHEALVSCIHREVFEELGIEIEVKSLFAKTDYTFGKRHNHLNFFWARILAGTPSLHVHSEITWTSFDQLYSYDFMPPDQAVLHLLKTFGFG